MLKKILNNIWTFFKKGWNWIWSKTEIDEKAIEVIEETKYRAKRVKEEMADVAKELKEAKEQAKDVIAAAKGAKRRGRPKKK